MSFIGDLGSVGTGFMQGMDQAEQMRMNALKYMMMKQQMDDDAQKRAALAQLIPTLASEGIRQQGMTPTDPSAMPSPVNITPQQGPGMQAGPPMGGGGAGPGPAIGGQPLPQRLPQPPMAGPPPVRPQGATPTVAPSAPIQGPAQPSNLDPEQMLIKMAQKIRAANPNAKPEVQAQMLLTQIELMKGLTPDLRTQLTLYGDQIRQYLGQLSDERARDIAGSKNATNITIKGMGESGQDRRQAARIAEDWKKTVYKEDQQNARLEKRLSGSVSPKDKNQLTLLKQKRTQAKAAMDEWIRNNQGVVDPDDPEYQKAQKAYDDAQQAVTDFLLDHVGGSSGGGTKGMKIVN